MAMARAEAERLAESVPRELYYAGRWRAARDAAAFAVVDPVTERCLATVAEAGPVEVDEAVSAARSAVADGPWGRIDGAGRGGLLNRVADLLEARSEEFAALESLDVGALISARHRDRVARYIAAGRADGAKLVAGGGQPQRPGYFVEPTLFADATNAMTIAREEIFGPVAAIIAFDSDDEAVAIANDCDYALAATVWTSDVSRAHTVARRIRAGAVAVNGWSPLDPALPWGGSRLSGHGRDLGWSGIEASTEEKTVTVVL
jgi:acyl-CoA reductase-like NAD-dependent aldehyde dehydrogenase